MATNNVTNTYSNSRYIVDNVTPGFTYTTIQSAINAALAVGGNASIWVRQGTYNENLTLYDGINIEGQEQSISIINGTHVPPVAGSCRFTRIGLHSGTHIFSSAAAGAALLNCLRCQFVLTNGYVYNLPNWTGELRIRWCTDYSTANGLVNNTAGSIITINHSLVGIGANVFTANGNVSIFSSDIECPFLLNGTGTSIFYGGSNFTNNITTADTHFLKFILSRNSSGATQPFTHNSATTMTLENCVIGTSNATAFGGTGTIKQIGVQYSNSNVIAGTITQSLDGVTRTAEVWSDNVTRMEDSGFYSWAAAGPYFDDTTLGTFQLLVGGTGYIKGKRVTWVAQNIAGMTAGNTYLIYIDSTGTIGKASTRTDALFVDNIVLFECLRDSTPITNNQVTVKENHAYSFQAGISNYLHDVAGIVIENVNNGANIALNGTQGIQINGADVLDDHGLKTTIPDSGGAAVTWVRMYTTAAGKWARQNATTTFTGYWNNAGTATALTGGRWGVYTLYVSKDTLNATTPTYIAVLDTAQYVSSASASTAIANGTTAKATNELASLELAQLGYIIYRESTATITTVTISKSTLKATLSTGGTNTASLVNTVVADFNNVLSSADTNVQAALDTIDDFGSGVGNQTANLYTGAAVKTVTLGSLNTTSATTIDTGTGALNLGAGATDHATTLGSVTGASLTAIKGGTSGVTITGTNGVITANSGTGTISIATDATNNTLNIGTGAGVKTCTFGSTNTTSPTTLQSGSGALNVTATGGALTINSGVGALSISNDASAATVNIATGAAAKVVTLGSTNGASSLGLRFGTADFTLASVTGTVMSALDTGEITYPLQPAFSARLSATASNVTGDGTDYTIICDGEIFDNNADYNNGSGVFTAPVTGKYAFQAAVCAKDLAAANDPYQFWLLGSSRGFQLSYIAGGKAFSSGGYLIQSGSCLLDMTAGDTATLHFLVSGATKIVDVYGTASPYFTWFTGYLVC